MKEEWSKAITGITIILLGISNIIDGCKIHNLKTDVAILKSQQEDLRDQLQSQLLQSTRFDSIPGTSFPATSFFSVPEPSVPVPPAKP